MWPASGTVAVVMDVTVPPDRAVEDVSHRIAYEVAPDAPVRSLIGSFEVDGPRLPVEPPADESRVPGDTDSNPSVPAHA